MIVFKYKEEISTKGKIKRPVADVFIKSKSDGWIEFHPYIDSGADITLIPLSLGKLIGLSVDEKKIEHIGGLSGNVSVIYFKQEIKIGGVQLTAQIAWALTEEVPPLLGRNDVFDKFNIQFRQRESLIIFNES